MRRLSAEAKREALLTLDLDALLTLLAMEAKRLADGHYTILSFTTHYKVMLGTPDLDTGDGREEVGRITGFKQLKYAIIDALVDAA